MRKLIRKWLGIDADNDRHYRAIRDMADAQFRSQVGNALVDLLQGKADSEYWRCLPAFDSPIGAYLRGQIAVALKGGAPGGEAFIDAVVERIRAKQLNGRAS